MSFFEYLNPFTYKKKPISSSEVNTKFTYLTNAVNYVAVDFLGTTAPESPVEGMTWADSNYSPPLQKKYVSGVWKWHGIVYATVAPDNPLDGAVIIYSTTKKGYIWGDDEWNYFVDVGVTPIYATEWDANTILKADSDDTPEALTVAEQTLVGRITGGSITALSVAQVKTLLSFIESLNEDSDPTLSANMDANNKDILDIKRVSFAGWIDDGNGGSEKTIDLSTGQNHILTLNSASCDLDFSNLDVGRYFIMIKQDGTGGRDLELPNGYWPGGFEYVPTSDAEAIDMISLAYDGSDIWYNVVGLDYQSTVVE